MPYAPYLTTQWFSSLKCPSRIYDVHIIFPFDYSAYINWFQCKYFDFRSLPVVISKFTRWYQEQQLSLRQQRQCQHLWNWRKTQGISNNTKNGVHANQRNDKVNCSADWSDLWDMQRGAHFCQRNGKAKYNRLIWWGMQRGGHFCQTNGEAKYGRLIWWGINTLVQSQCN